ncbi:MAG: dihydropteroate synthase [Candidatus Omnitrophica bacterium]|jgi:5-methyltetrahydrofolate corrinoid/iron sulfur protein methyltransferase|nr:dihydropteroate synthase [Candidatus Omnitrophota bacterium]
MFIVGELINGMYSNVAAAIRERKIDLIQRIALEQIQAGADALDVNCGPTAKNPKEDIQWLIDAIQQVTDKPLAVDSSRFEVIEAGLSRMKNPAIINSTTSDPEKLNKFIPLAKKHNAKLIGLTISQKGIPQNKDQRLELAAIIVSTCQEQGFPIEDLFIDPILLPVNVAQQQMKEILESIKEFKMLTEPSPKTIIGLSNVSQGAHFRSLINRTFLTMAINYGLDAAILDPKDKQLMDTSITTELILNKHIYCDSYLEAYLRK